MFHLFLCLVLTLVVLRNKPIYMYHIGFAKKVHYWFRKAPKTNIEISVYQKIDIDYNDIGEYRSEMVLLGLCNRLFY
mgnify:CR=1 FL=1